MTPSELKEQIAIELESIEDTLRELELLRRESSQESRSKRDIAAAGLFLANFYGGIENIFKRICRFHGVALPSGDNWHAVLFETFCNTSEEGLPGLLSETLARDLAPFRRLRHVVHHGYGIQLR
ncbi:MAG: hypothetical protein O3B01_19805 [Planctomycetota bacterium]|nr:hypothetical protein [Planctomycetota bacterium]